MKVIIFGAGENAKRFICEMHKEIEIIGFLDNDQNKWNTSFCGETVWPPENIKKLHYDYIVIASIYVNEIEEQLIGMDVDYRKIIYANTVYEYEYAEFMNMQVWRFYDETYAEQIIHEIVQEEYKRIKMYQSDRLYATNYLFISTLGRKFDTNLPTLNDKVRYLELYRYGRLEKLCTDKYQVRKYVQYLGLGEEVLPELYFVKDNVEEIDFSASEIPDKFILKVNNGCGYNIVCRNKRTLKYSYVKFRLNKWMQKRHELLAFEFHYENIPSKIICEELLETPDSKPLTDYKYFCGNGKIICILVCTERDEVTGESYHYYFDRNWNQLDYAVGNVRQVPAKNCIMPKNLDKMNEIAEKLAYIFPFVRVDLYNIDGKIFFGELTFSPCGGVITIQSDEAQKVIGSCIDVNYRLGENEELYKKVIMG